MKYKHKYRDEESEMGCLFAMGITLGMLMLIYAFIYWVIGVLK